jgi:hypothetical protein
MSEHGSDGGGVSMPAAPKAKAAPDRTLEADESGRVIMSLLQRAATMAKDDCTRAMDLAHKVASGLRATEERAREAEAAAAHFRNRATQAEAWLVRIQDEVEQIFFVKKDEEITALKPDDLSPNGNGRP